MIFLGCLKGSSAEYWEDSPIVRYVPSVAQSASSPNCRISFFCRAIAFSAVVLAALRNSAAGIKGGLAYRDVRSVLLTLPERTLSCSSVLFSMGGPWQSQPAI